MVSLKVTAIAITVLRAYTALAQAQEPLIVRQSNRHQIVDPEKLMILTGGGRQRSPRRAF